MNCVMYGRHRDERIITLIKEGKAFTRGQIQALMFSKLKEGKRRCQHRLAALSGQQRIKKWERSKLEPTIYYVDRKPKQIDHILLINDVYVSLMIQKHSWHSVEFYWKYPVLDVLIADALIIIYTKPDKQGKKVFFLEVERHPSKRFDKDTKYLDAFKRGWTKEPWSRIEQRNGKDTYVFPSILIVTPEELEVKSQLDFIIASPEQVKKDIYSLILRR